MEHEEKYRDISASFEYTAACLPIGRQKSCDFGLEQIFETSSDFIFKIIDSRLNNSKINTSEIMNFSKNKTKKRGAA